MKKRSLGNPFRIHGVVTGDYFTDRDDELNRLVHALTEPGSKLLVYSPRRMGKTSAVINAVDTVNKNGGHAFLADLSTASTAVDMSNRILAAASRIIGKKWRNFVTDVVSRLNVTVLLTPNPATGIPLPSIDIIDRTAVRGRATIEDVVYTFEDIIAEEHDLLYECWLSFTAHQQNILRAVAAGEKGLTTRETLAKFALGSSGTVTNTINSLIRAGHLIRQDAYTRTKVKTPTGYDFDSPFFKGWVVRHTLSDIGLPER